MIKVTLPILACSLFLLSIFSCDEASQLTIPEYENKLVIDGYIEQGGFPRVVLSKSTSYFNQIDSTTVRKLLVTTAKVTVSDGITEEILTLKPRDNHFPPHVYQGTELEGVEGRTYTLTVELKGEKYTATTTIPPRAKLNRLWFQLTADDDSLGYLYGNISDDPNSENFYRLFTQRENKDQKFVPVYYSSVSDQLFNGQSFTFSMLRGRENNTNVIDDLFFKKGDTVNVKLCTIDKAHFDFWRTLERELYIIGNPFSSSGNEIISNIDGKKALGVWGGYGTTYYQLILK